MGRLRPGAAGADARESKYLVSVTGVRRSSSAHYLVRWEPQPGCGSPPSHHLDKAARPMIEATNMKKPSKRKWSARVRFFSSSGVRLRIGNASSCGGSVDISLSLVGQRTPPPSPGDGQGT